MTNRSVAVADVRSRVRAVARHLALDVLSVISRRKQQSALATNRVQNLYFHFLPESDTEQFLTLIRVLAENHVFIPYSEAMDRIREGDIDQPYLSISFDDGFESNIRAARLLADEGLSACFFVCPDMVGKNRQYLEEHFSGDLGIEKRMMSWDEIRSLVDMGHEIGSHTLDHSVLADLPPVEAQRQIEESKRILDSEVGETRHFAWPRGRFFHFGDTLATTVFRAGYRTCTSAERGAHLDTAAMDNFCVRRENCVADWPLRHTLYLLARSVTKGRTNQGQWPTGWNVPDNA